jgi:mannose-6-phosphate isomerase
MSTPPAESHLVQLIPTYHPRVWGGARLQPGAPQPIGEAWVIYEGNRIAGGPLAGRTLVEAAQTLGPALLGAAAVRRTGARFPLLIKLLDCHDWLSIQVHPDDAQAAQLEGPGHFGKTEAWHILEAEAGARLIAGVRPGTSPEALAAAIRAGAMEPLAQYHAIRAGDTVLMPAGTLHALGPGLLLYEVQQTSDITYRVYDWGRPASAGRALHLEQSAQVANAHASARLTPLPRLPAHDQHTLTRCAYFCLELLAVERAPLTLDTRAESFHALTVTAGRAEIACGAERIRLAPFESVVVAASAGAYSLRPVDGPVRLLRASVPGEEAPA